MTERSGIEIDYCPQCRGVWLDKGELDKIIERTGVNTPSIALQPAYQQPAAHQQFDGHNGHHDGHHTDKRGYNHKKKKSILSELFDF
jgi:hypothetical protein